MWRTGLGVVAALALLAPSGPSGAEMRRVEVALSIPPSFLERLLVEQVFREPGPALHVAAPTNPCSEITLSEPRLEPLGGSLWLTAHGSAQAGFRWLGTCYRPISWEGEVEAEEQVRLARGADAVEFRVVDSWLRDASPWLAIPALWDWVKPAVHPRLETLRVDLVPLLDDVRRTLPLFATGRDAAALERLADSVALAAARVDDAGLALTLRFDVELAGASPPPASDEPRLTPAEIAAFEATLRRWDAFLTFVVKAAGHDALEPALRAALLAVLIDARHEIVAALAEPGRDGDDRVRSLFLASWTRLQPALATLSGGAEGFRYLAFVASADALAALDAAGPGFGLEISEAGLRRLARTLAPDTRDDPLAWSDAVDPALRETFGFDAALPAEPPEPHAEPPEPAPAPAPEPAPDAAGSPDGAASWLDWLVPAAHAAAAPLPPAAPYSSPLDGLVPSLAELDGYLPAVDALLRESAARVFATGRLDADYRPLFERLVLATAWQESCWRQYVRRGRAVVPLRSKAGALGLMQVNPHVWRGFYSVEGLSWSVGYNAQAGSEILLHYLRDYAIARGEEQHGGPDALARASYAAYHGGPSHLTRYREPKRWRRALIAVDRAFHAKYLEIAAGRESGVRRCFPG